MADEEFIKKIGLRKNNKENDDVSVSEIAADNTVSEEILSESNENSEPCEDAVDSVDSGISDVADETPVEDSAENTAEESNENENESENESESENENETDTKNENDEEFPTSIQFEDELIRVKYKLRYRKLLKNTLYSLLIVAAISVLIATLFLPVLEIYGSSMNPTLENGDIVISIKTTNLDRGDICGMYYNNHLLVKRVVGLPGDSIEMDDAGNLFVNGEYVDEPYVSEKILGECDLEFPYIVPEQTVFILGDNRPVAVDSRNEQFGCISYEEIQGKIVFRVWPLKGFGPLG